MNKLRRKLLKFSILQLLMLFMSNRTFSLNKNNKKTKSYKKKEFKGFVWYLDKKDDKGENDYSDPHGKL